MQFLYGLEANRLVNPPLRAILRLVPYTKALGSYLLGFAAGYVVIAIVFSGWYMATWIYDRDPFANIRTEPSFLDFLYFSVVTITTLGYGDIHPLSTRARILACLEVVLGVGWLTIVFGVIAAIAPRLLARVERDTNP